MGGNEIRLLQQTVHAPIVGRFQEVRQLAIHLFLLLLHLGEVCLYGQVFNISNGIEEGLHTLHKQIGIVDGTVAMFDDGNDETGLCLTVVVVECSPLGLVEGQEVADVLLVGESCHRQHHQ